MSIQDEEFYCFGEDVEAEKSVGKTMPSAIIPWKILMVDDAPEVHQVTRMVLRNVRFLDRPIEFISGYSAAEGRKLVLEHTDAAVIFLDVVMETGNAGLEMVKFIRETACNKLLRIILRTGQPGDVPEAEVIQKYDINDYKNKAELSEDRLLTTLIVALRSYHDMRTIEESRRGLEWILRSSTELMQVHSTELFLAGLLKQIQVMFNFGQDAILCARSKPNSSHPILPEPKVLAGSGQYEHMVGAELSGNAQMRYRDSILNAFESGCGSFDEDNFSIYFYSRDVFEIVIVLESQRVPTTFDRTIIDVFCNTAAVSLSNINLLENMERKVDERTVELSKKNKELQDAHDQLLQSEKMASIGQLAAGVAHEINNPIGFVNSNLGSLEDYLHNLMRVIDEYEKHEHLMVAEFPERIASIDSVKTEVELKYLREDVFTLLNESKEGLMRVKKIVQDLKDFSHVGAAEWQFADLRAGIDSTLNIVNNEIKYKAKVVKEYSQLPEVECLPLELNQVFMNMLVNAAHAIKDFGEIVIRTGMQDEMVWIEFSDNGEGISPENLKRIFDPFFTTKPIGKGTGLGLSLSYGIVQKHHGQIEVGSVVGKGTHFRIWLPIEQAHSNSE